MVDDDLADRLSDLESAAGLTVGGVAVVYDLPDSGVGTVTHELDDSDPIDSYTEATVPNHLPVGYRGGITALGGDDLADLWTDMPADVRKQELVERTDADDPVPAVLDGDDLSGTDSKRD